MYVFIHITSKTTISIRKNDFSLIKRKYCQDDCNWLLFPDLRTWITEKLVGRSARYIITGSRLFRLHFHISCILIHMYIFLYCEKKKSHFFSRESTLHPKNIFLKNISFIGFPFRQMSEDLKDLTISAPYYLPLDIYFLILNLNLTFLNAIKKRKWSFERYMFQLSNNTFNIFLYCS